MSDDNDKKVVDLSQRPRPARDIKDGDAPKGEFVGKDVLALARAAAARLKQPSPKPFSAAGVLPPLLTPPLPPPRLREQAPVKPKTLRKISPTPTPLSEREFLEHLFSDRLLAVILSNEYREKPPSGVYDGFIPRETIDVEMVLGIPDGGYERTFRTSVDMGMWGRYIAHRKDLMLFSAHRNTSDETRILINPADIIGVREFLHNRTCINFAGAGRIDFEISGHTLLGALRGRQYGLDAQTEPGWTLVDAHPAPQNNTRWKRFNRNTLPPYLRPKAERLEG